MVERLADSLVLLWGWRRAAVAVVVGALAAASQAPFHAFPVLWISFPVLVFLIDGAVEASTRGGVRRWRAAFVVGWCFGFGYFLAGLWWIGAAFLVDLGQFGWMLPFAIGGLSAGLGLFTGLGVLVARFGWRDGPMRIVALAVGISIAEWLRGHVLTGFPWNTFGYGLAANDMLMQAASLIGIEGMTFLAVLIFASPAALAGKSRADRAFVAAGLMLFFAVLGFGAWRLQGPDPGVAANVKLRIMQPAVDQWQKWRPEHKAEIMARYVELSTGGKADGLAGVTHLVWPESAFPFLIANETWALTTLANLLPAGRTLLTGAIRAEPAAAGESRPRYYNSIMVIGDDAQLLAAYDKVHLVPFGEFLPFQETLEAMGLRQLTHLRGGFTPGPNLTSLSVPNAPKVGPLVCYEAIFPGEVVASGDRPDWLLNVTNDGWFGLTPGPFQHLHQARVRAVEEGLPMVRAANSGISVVTDAYGRVKALLPLGTAGAIDSELPNPLSPTVYAQNRYLPLLVMFLGIIWLALSRYIRT